MATTAARSRWRRTSASTRRSGRATRCRAACRRARARAASRSCRRGTPFTPFDYGTTDGYQFFLENAVPLSKLEALFKEPNWLYLDQAHHSTYDAYWQARDLSRHMHGVKCAVLTVGGWYDAEDLSGPFKTYHAIEQQSPGIFNALVVGPWVHGGWARWDGASLGRVQFGSKTGRVLARADHLPVLRAAPEGQRRRQAAGSLHVRDGHQRVAPVRGVAAEGRAAEGALLPRERKALVRADRPRRRPSFDEYVSDPAHPVPFIPYTDVGRTEQEYMVADQRLLHAAPGRARVPDRSAGGGRDGGGADLAEAARLDVGHRLGFRGEADRRVPVRLSRTPRRRPTRRGRRTFRCRPSGWPATSNWCAASRCARSSATAGRSRSR